MAISPIYYGIVAGLAAYGAYSQNQAASQQAKAQEQMADFNQKVAKSNAEIAVQQAGQQEESQRRDARKVLGQQRAALAESGIGLDGTGSDLYQQSATDAELDALNIRYNGDLQATGFKNNANLEGFKAKVYEKQASDFNTASYVSAGTALLSGYSGYSTGQAKLKASKAGLQQS